MLDTVAPHNLPSINAVLSQPSVAALVESYGRRPLVSAVRTFIDEARASGSAIDEARLAETVSRRLAARQAIRLKPVYNLTGTVLHTNLGRAPLAEEAIQAMATAAGASAVEFDLTKGRRGERDAHVEAWLKELTGAEAALVVNNNAAAVLLALNAVASSKQVPVSRGELVEIGGAFRVPDVMRRAGVKLVEVGTTNRTHLRDYEEAIVSRTAALMTVHPSNYVVQGFSAKPAPSEIAALAHRHGLPSIEDMGSGALIDLASFGLPKERTPAEALTDGADLVTFSGDKLLGGPQAGLVIGRKAIVEKLRKNPLKRAMRLDKVTLAALEATLALYDDPARAVDRIPALRLLTRPVGEIRELAERLAPAYAAALGDGFAVSVEDCRSQIGSGALPVDLIPSAALVARPTAAKGKGKALTLLAAALRSLPRPVAGRVADDALWLDLRCLEDKGGFAAQLKAIDQSLML